MKHRFSRSAARECRHLAALIAAVTLVLPVGCTATFAAFLRIPIRVSTEHPGGSVIVRVPLDALREKMARFDATRAAFYSRGRDSLPAEFVDDDGDGQADAVLVKLPPGGSEHWLIVVSPGTPNATPLPDGGSAQGVVVDLARATR